LSRLNLTRENRQPESLAAAVDWRRAVEPYVGPDARRASLQLGTTLIPLALVMWGAHAALSVSPLLALALVLPAAGLLVRTFILMHDCAHGSFFPSRRLNDVVGFVTGVLTLTPFVQWRRDHALHHASSGDLDRRGHGDVPTLTVREYLARSPRARLGYRVIRHPAVLLLGGPFHLAVNQRRRDKSVATRSPQTTSVWLTNAAIAGLLAIAFVTVGWKSIVFAYALPYYIAAMAGVWLFYVQHQFEEAYWAPHDEWDYVDAALRGSTHLQLSPILRWFTGSIGLHHVHHVAPKIPNYRLQPCHDANAMFQRSPIVTLRSGTAALRLALWDEDRQRMVRFRDITAP
jgi:omega-6 fatty acid desaturase (delta-12 desaturase)